MNYRFVMRSHVAYVSPDERHDSYYLLFVTLMISTIKNSKVLNKIFNILLPKTFK